MELRLFSLAVAVIATLAAVPVAAQEEGAKYGGTLTYMIPADAPPSFDGHREGTFALIQAAAPFYSVLVRINPYNPDSTTDIVCDLCTAMPQPTDNGKTWTFKIRRGVVFHDSTPLTAYDVAASFNEIAFPPPGVLSPRSDNFMMVKDVAAPDASTVVFHLNFATSTFLPALANPFNWIYEKKILDQDPHWYEKNIMGSGPFKFAGYQIGQSITGVRNPDYYHKGLPYLDGFIGIYAPKQAVQLDAIRADRAAAEFRGYPPSAIDQLKQQLDGQITVQQSDWNCAAAVWFNHQKKPFDDVRVRRALTLAIDRWGSAPGLSRIANVHTVGSIVFPGSPLAPSKAQLETLAGFWPDIEKSRTEARRLLQAAGAEGLSFELLNRDIDQPYKYNGTWLVDQWSKIGVHATQHVVPTGPWFAAFRSGDFTVGLGGNCQSIVNPPIDVQTWLPRSVSNANFGYYDDQKEIDLYEKMLHETELTKQRTDMFDFVKWVMDDQVHMAFLLWWNRLVPLRSYVNGWKVSPSHYLNQDLSTIWLSPPHCGKCGDEPTKTAG
jgi:peptide/nickel transport system substrate-binding protein